MSARSECCSIQRRSLKLCGQALRNIMVSFDWAELHGDDKVYFEDQKIKMKAFLEILKYEEKFEKKWPKTMHIILQDCGRLSSKILREYLIFRRLYFKKNKTLSKKEFGPLELFVNSHLINQHFFHTFGIPKRSPYEKSLQF